MLRCISYYFNPNNSEKIRQDFKNFKDNFNGPLIVAEVAFEDQSFWIDDSIRIQARITITNIVFYYILIGNTSFIKIG